MKKQKRQPEEINELNSIEEPGMLRKMTIKELIAPSGIDASKIDHLEIQDMLEVFSYHHYHVCVLFQSYSETYTFLEM